MGKVKQIYLVLLWDQTFVFLQRFSKDSGTSNWKRRGLWKAALWSMVEETTGCWTSGVDGKYLFKKKDILKRNILWKLPLNYLSHTAWSQLILVVQNVVSEDALLHAGGKLRSAFSHGRWQTPHYGSTYQSRLWKTYWETANDCKRMVWTERSIVQVDIYRPYSVF